MTRLSTVPPSSPQTQLARTLVSDLRMLAITGADLPSRSDVVRVLQEYCELTSAEVSTVLDPIYGDPS